MANVWQSLVIVRLTTTRYKLTKAWISLTEMTKNFKFLEIMGLGKAYHDKAQGYESKKSLTSKDKQLQMLGNLWSW